MFDVQKQNKTNRQTNKQTNKKITNGENNHTLQECKKVNGERGIQLVGGRNKQAGNQICNHTSNQPNGETKEVNKSKKQTSTQSNK